MKTLGIDEKDRARDDGLHPKHWIVRVGSAGAPQRRPQLFQLENRSHVVLGRRDDDDDDAPAVLNGSDRLEIADPWMSSEHAELELSGEGWQVRDLGSSNGTLIWGQRRSAALLSDGDLFETGGTFWIFRRMISREDLLSSPEEGVLGSLYPPYVEMSHRLARIARTRVPVMVLGATGTGKEVIAREIHRASKRPGPFVAINTAAIQRTLVASELFGVEKGAHSTADVARPGQIRAAEQGTFLLDEIGDMPSEVQVSLLRMLQESEVMPVGGTTPVKVDVRIICATHQDLAALVSAGTFRADLFARVKGCTLETPLLEDRAEDIGLLIARFLERYGGEDLTFTTAAYRALLQYPWPLNVRELEKAIETSVALASDGRIELEHLPREIAVHQPAEARIRDTISANIEDPQARDAALERELVRLMTVHRGNLAKVARAMGRSRMQVYRWIEKLNLNPEMFRS